jgi:hypothetical protein
MLETLHRALLRELERRRAGGLAHGIHLISVQSADGNVIVGHSHLEDEGADSFAGDSVDS